MLGMQKPRELDVGDILSELGYRENIIIENELIENIKKNSEHFLNIVNPKWVYRFFKTESLENNKIKLTDNDVVFEGVDIFNHLNGSKFCAIMAVTCGMEIERELIKLQRTSMTDAIIFDACANVYVEMLADFVESLIIMENIEKRKNHNDKKIEKNNYRYSPGYGDFSIKNQGVVLNLLDCQRRIGLTATENSLLIPHKSITAIIGFFDEDVENTHSSCKRCSLYLKCDLRKEGKSCAKRK